MNKKVHFVEVGENQRFLVSSQGNPNVLSGPSGYSC